MQNIAAAAAAVEENKCLADYPELMKISFDEEHEWLHQFDNDLAGVSDSEVEACFRNLEQLSPTQTSDPSLDMNEVYDAMPISFRLPGGSKKHPVQMAQEQHDCKKGKRKLKKKEQQDDSNDVVCRCSQADLLKMTIEYALTVFGMDKNLKVPNVELKEMAAPEKESNFSSQKTEELITDVMNSRFRDEIPTDGPMIFSLSQRISGWSISQIKRSKDGKLDTFYHHEEAKLKLRSKMEVMKFILYEYPKKSRLSKKKIPKDGSSEPKKRMRMDAEPGRGFL